MAKFYKNKYRIESSRLKHWDYSMPAYYYVTICTQNKKCYFGKIENVKMTLSDTGKIARNEWLNTIKIRKFVELDQWVTMPNHLHGIIIINRSVETLVKTRSAGVERDGTGVETHSDASLRRPVNNLSNIVRGFKSASTKEIRKINPKFSWQPRYYDHIIRNEKDLFRIRNYIQTNPLKWELDEEYSVENS